MGNLKDKAAKGFVWIFAGTLSQNILQFISLVFLARLLTPKDFGVVSVAMIVVGLLKIFSELGIAPGIVQRHELKPEDIKTANVLTVSLGFVFGLIVYSLADNIALLFEMPDLVQVIQVLAFILPITGLMVVGQALLQRALLFKKIAMFTFTSYFISNIFVAIPLALNDYGLWSLVYSTLLQYILMLIFIHVTLKESRMYGFSWGSAKALFVYGFGQSLGKLANYLANQGDNMIVGKLLGAEVLGLYSKAYQLMMLPANILGTVIDKVLFPIMSSIQNEKQRLSNAYITALSVVVMVTMPLSAVLVIFAEDIISIIFGQQWIGSAHILQILSLALVFRITYKFSDTLSRAKGSVYKRAWRQGIYAMFVFIGAWFGSTWGAAGVAWGTALAILVNFLLMLQLSQKLIGFSWGKILLLHFKHFLISISMVTCILMLRKELVFYKYSSFSITVISIFFGMFSLCLIWFLVRSFISVEINFIKISMSKIISRKK